MKINKFRLSYTSIALTLSWLMALLGLIIYIQNLNQYFFVSRDLFIFPNFLWQFFKSLNISIDVSIRLMLWGTNLFTLLIVDFTINYTGIIKRKIRLLLESILAIWFILLAVVYDPYLYEFFYSAYFNSSSTRMDFESFYDLQSFIHLSTSLINFFLIFISIIIMIRFYVRNRKYTFFNRALRLTVISLLMVIFVYLLVFFRFPYFLKTVSILSNTVRYQRIDLGVFNLLYGYIPYLMIFTLLFTLYVVFDQRRFVVEDESKNLKILRDVSMANSSSRIFTHSVKNQLVAILADTEMLMDSLEQQNESYKLAESIKNSTQQTIQHLNDLRRFMDSLTVELEVFKIDDFIQSIDLKALFTDNIKLDFDLNSHAECLIDKELLEEALLVIIKNALEAIHKERGYVSITTQKVDKYVIIKICDNGTGISKEDMDKIFDPFFSTKPSRYNWGVGLTFSQKIALAHHGRIEVESKINNGTCFSIYLPIID